MNNENLSATPLLQQRNKETSTHQINVPPEFNPVPGKPFNIDKVTLEQIDKLNITYIFTTGRSASTLLGVMLMMHEQVVFTSEEIFPIALQQKYSKIKKWNDAIIQEYCTDFVLMSEGKLYPLFCGKDVLYQLLSQFKEQLNYERVIRISYLAFGVDKDLSKITTIVDKQLRYYLAEYYLKLFPQAKILLLVRDPRDNVFSKYNRAIRKGLSPINCIYIETWKTAFETYYKIINNYSVKYMVINYERLINDSVKTMNNISEFLSIAFTENYFKYYEMIENFFKNISHPQLKEHFTITHKSLTQPINPQKVNEWKNFMDKPEIAKIINATWYRTNVIAEKLDYTQHEPYRKEELNCIKNYLKVKFNFISSYIYFNFFPYTLKRIIKIKKYPYRLRAVSSYDRFLRRGYL